jgi:hypothetical protein
MLCKWKNYVQKNGTTIIPTTETTLSNWVHDQRKLHRNELLSKCKITQLKDAGFVFAPRKFSYNIKGFKKCRRSQLKAASFVQGPILKSANYHDEIEQDYTYNSLFDLNKGIATGISSELTANGAINMLVTAEDVSIIAVTNVARLRLLM